MVTFGDFILGLIVSAGLGYWVATLRARRSGTGGGEPSAIEPSPRPRAGDRATAPQLPVSEAEADDDEPEGPESGPPLDTARLYDIASQLEQNEANSYADPHDIVGHPLFEEGVSMLMGPEATVGQVVGYVLGTNWVLGVLASEALARREDAGPAVDRVLAHIGQAGQWPLFFRLRFLAAHADGAIIGRVLGESKDWWPQEPVTVMAVEEFIEQQVARGMALTLGDALENLPPKRVDEIEEVLRRLRPGHAEPLLAELEAHRGGSLDRHFVSSAGRLWSGVVEGGPVFETESLEECVAEMRRAVEGAAPRSILLVGEGGVGKTIRRRAFSRHLVHDGWRIFETSGSQLLSGTRYIGDIESRVSDLRANANVAKRVAIFVERMTDLATAGSTDQHPVSVLDHLWPAIRSRELFFVGEAGPAGHQLLERRYPGFAAAFKVIRVSPAAEAEASDLVRELLSDAGLEIGSDASNEVVGQAIQLARSYLTHLALPGSALDLVASAIAKSRTEGDEPQLTRKHVLDALGELTGLPEEILDEDAQLDVEGLREAFRARVIGQDEAVDCLVERIAMLKAGLTDPLRPVGVYLFAGPTGTGKTEVAKTLAELLFGSPDQMIRLDMSEFQTTDSLERLIGRPEHPGDPGAASLVQRIRRQPFSVVLLDEFEKSHPKVWDLFLQVFDDGRLTDRQGTLADFRHAIIILTSNLGATISSESGIGFVGKAGQFSSVEVLRAVNRTFRREFVNRLDKVVVFRALSREVMRLILNKELEQALTRRGFQRKAWAVEWEDSAVEFLLGKGFTPDLGARPLRRAIERHLLAPLSVTIVENRVPEGEQFLFIRSDGRTLEVEFVDPDAEPEGAGSVPVDAAQEHTVPSLVLQPSGTPAEESFLVERVASVEGRVEAAEWQRTKAEGLAEINRDGFWDRDDRFEILDRVELMDRIESATASLASLAGRMERSHRSAELIRRVAEKLFVLEQGMEDLDRGRPTMGFLGARLLGEDADHPEAPHFFERVVEMYRSWASRRRMQWEELQGRAPGPASPLIASVSGFGAFATLDRETGLHVLEVPTGESRFERVRVRVVAVPQVVSPNLPAAERLDAARSALRAREEDARTVVRRYRVDPSPLVRDAAYGWRTGRIDAIWNGDFDVWPPGA